MPLARARDRNQRDMVWLVKAAGASLVVADMPEVSRRMSPRPSRRYEPTIHQADIRYPSFACPEVGRTISRNDSPPRTTPMAILLEACGWRWPMRTQRAATTGA